MNLFARIFGGRKVSEARTALTITQLGQPQQTPKNYEAFAREGYQENNVVFKCVSFIAKACAAIDWELYSGESEVEEHPLLDLLDNPNPMQGRAAFFEAVVAYYKLAGNTYVEANRGLSRSGPPSELWSIRPDRMKVIPGQFGLPAAYRFEANGGFRDFPVDALNPQNSPIMHMKTFHPTNPWYGLSPIEAAMYAIDQHNAAAKWNLSLLQNMATPSGAISVKDGDTSRPLTDEQFNRLKAQVDAQLSGPQNARRPLVLEGGMSWTPTGITPTDMDWIEGRNMSARDTALVFGVPPLLLNIPGDSTYANYQEARLAFYEDEVIPTMDMLRDELNRWLVPMFGEGLFLDYCKNEIEPLQAKRVASMAAVDKIQMLTDDEKRAMFGLEALPESEIDDPANEDGDTEGDPNAENEEPNGGQEPIVEDDEKQINPFGKGDRLRIHKRMNAKRNKLIRAMQLDMQDEYKELANTLSRISTTDSRLAEYHAIVAIEKMSRDLIPIIQRHVKRAYLAFGNDVLMSGKAMATGYEVKTERFRLQAADWARKRAASSVTDIEGTNMKIARAKIREAVASAIENGDTGASVGKALAESIAGLSDSRADVIARTEIAVASNAGSIEGAKELNVPGLRKEWVSVNDDRTRDDHAEVSGTAVALDEKFQVGDDMMDGPGDPSASAENVINCRCVLVYARGE